MMQYVLILYDEWVSILIMPEMIWLSEQKNKQRVLLKKDLESSPLPNLIR